MRLATDEDYRRLCEQVEKLAEDRIQRNARIQALKIELERLRRLLEITDEMVERGIEALRDPDRRDGDASAVRAVLIAALGQDARHVMPDVPVYERPGRELGSTWTQRLRSCENCEQAPGAEHGRVEALHGLLDDPPAQPSHRGCRFYEEEQP
jgi:hypothetical protein